MSDSQRRIPFLRPKPPSLSKHVDRLEQIEASGIYSNFGPVNRAFEDRIIAELFGGQGYCTTVCNATIGLILAIRAQLINPPSGAKLALMPSFTFAATAHAAFWAGLKPLLCDIDLETWLPDANAEDDLLDRRKAEIAALVPYATFGACLDLDRYAELAERCNLALVIDAAASLGSLDKFGAGFGAGFKWPVVFSMHVTKTFASSEAGLVYSSDQALIDRIRVMANFGFGEPRHATMLGLNAKLSEVGALIASLRLDGFDEVIEHRERLFQLYRARLPECGFQAETGLRQAHQFVPVLLPEGTAGRRDGIVEALRLAGIGTGQYFSPHLAEQAYFKENAEIADLPKTAAVSRRALSMPLSDTMTEDDVICITDCLRAAMSE